MSSIRIDSKQLDHIESLGTSPASSSETSNGPRRGSNLYEANAIDTSPGQRHLPAHYQPSHQPSHQPHQPMHQSMHHHPGLHDDFQTATLTRRRGGRSPASTMSREFSGSIQLHHQAYVHGGGLGGGFQSPLCTNGARPHELQRPDSVITTSSIVSSDTASQVGDSSDVGHPPSVYAISGLYGPNRGPSSSSAKARHSAEQLTTAEKPRSSTLPQESSLNMHSDLTHTQKAKTAHAFPTVVHRRQSSNPVSGTNAGGGVPLGVNKWPQAHTSQTIPAILPSSVVSRVSGHRRSSSYGHHRALTNSVSLGAGGPSSSHHAAARIGHRRTGSSVIETLQTLTCSGAETDKTREESIAQFLENLKKEQQEKFEKQELHEMQDELEDLRECGIPGCHPAFIQGFASIKVFVFLLSILVTLQQALASGYISSVITTIEKRYEIPSSISGIIASMYELGNLGTVIFVSYLGSRRHIPVWIGMGVLVMGIGSITFSLPHFLAGNYMLRSDLNTSNDNICRVPTHGDGANPLLEQLPALDKIKSLTQGLNSPPLGPNSNNFIPREDNCIEQADESAAMPIVIFMIAQMLLGCGGSPLFTLGTTYIDNHVKRDDSSMYIGIMYSMCAFGPVCGFLLGAYLLSHYVDTFSFDLTNLHIEKVKVYIDEKYHHAMDPSIRPKHRNSESSEDVESYGKDIKDIPRSMWKLLTNKIYMITCMGACMELIIVSGFIIFLPKYLETQFNLGKSMASMFTGGIAIPGACIGIFFGGYILKRLQLRPKGAVQLVLFFNILCLSCYAMLFFFGCDNVKMAGTTMPYSTNTSEPFKINLTASCNFGCECDMNDVQPVCGANGLTYFSPCHAGCTSLGSTSDNYTDCACVLNSLDDPFAGANPLHGASAEVTMVPVATAGPCYSQCQMIMPFMVLLFFMTLVVAVTQMPVLMVVLRSVEEEEKAFALGIQFVIFRLFGYIPSPILFGNVIDSTCLLWKSTCAGEEGGRCLMYDIELFRYKYVGVCCVIKIISVIIFLIDWWLIRQRQQTEKKANVLTVGEVVNSIISLDKLFDPEGPLWLRMNDPEEGVNVVQSAPSGENLHLVENPNSQSKYQNTETAAT
eukprot:TCALIF_00274-PB protein Name:"Similar to SLCO5A1 Solute carrier organic anion transporter family member 5A1 (Homo sapiens)" AED:0.11 eAED:0.11 QI:460/0.90/0.91/1/0.63/0.58/12/137/1099